MKTTIGSRNSSLKGHVPEIALLREENAGLREKLVASENQIEFLEEQIKLLRAILYGKSSEKKGRADGPSPEQPLLPFNEAEETAPMAPLAEKEKTPVAAHTRNKPGRRPLPAHLPRVDEEIDLSDAEKVAECGCQLKCIGEEISEKLEIVPAKIFVRRIIRKKYGVSCLCPTGVNAPGEVKTAPMPPQLIPQGNVTAGLVAHVVVAKYVDAIPLYRQEQQLMRLGLDIGRGTLASWVLLAAAACRRLLELMIEMVYSGPVMNMDETRVQVMREPGRSNTSESYMWVMHGGPVDRPIIIFRYDPSRAGRVPKELLRDYRGYLQTDGYIGYEAIGDREGIRHLGCWAHARRKFVEVVKGTPKGSGKAGVAQEILDEIEKLYSVEKDAKARDLSPDEIVACRAEESKPVLDGIKEILDKRSRTTPPRSLLGRAISYALNQWPRLIVYLENGDLRPDNNVAENAIRPFAVGRRNWLFAGSPRGAEGSATLYSIIETAKANGLEPYAYLRLLFT
ncbi:MAG: IS66 family transposase, partial [Acidobacteriota bacterium]